MTIFHIVNCCSYQRYASSSSLPNKVQDNSEIFRVFVKEKVQIFYLLAFIVLPCQFRIWIFQHCGRACLKNGSTHVQWNNWFRWHLRNLEIRKLFEENCNFLRWPSGFSEMFCDWQNQNHSYGYMAYIFTRNYNKMPLLLFKFPKLCIVTLLCGIISFILANGAPKFELVSSK